MVYDEEMENIEFQHLCHRIGGEIISRRPAKLEHEPPITRCVVEVKGGEGFVLEKQGEGISFRTLDTDKFIYGVKARMFKTRGED